MLAAAPLWLWVAFIAFVLAMLALDLGVFHRRPHEVRAGEAALWTAVWVALALLFAAGLFHYAGRHAGLTFLTGYLVEESLSADNIFVMVLIFGYFGVPKACQHRVLFYGILGALVMRGLFIGAGAALVAGFHWVLYLFGALLVYTGVRMAFGKDEQFDGENNRVVKLVRRVVPLSSRFEGGRFFTRENARIVATPLLLVLVVVEVTDLVFAVDSIPAIFGVTTNPFVVFTSNIFAVLGLRSLYFVLAAVIDRFYLLKYGLAVILSFVGLKMLGEPFVHVETSTTLIVVLSVLVAAVAASLIAPRRDGD
jgi:tellurite resistance protein TerC